MDFLGETKTNRIQFRLSENQLLGLENYRREGESLSQAAKRLLIELLAQYSEGEATLPAIYLRLMVFESSLKSSVDALGDRLARIESAQLNQGKRSQKGFGK